MLAINRISLSMPVGWKFLLTLRKAHIPVKTRAIENDGHLPYYLVLQIQHAVFQSSITCRLSPPEHPFK